MSRQAADWIIDLGPEAWPGLDPGARDGGSEKACPRARPEGRRRHAGGHRQGQAQLHRRVPGPGAGAEPPRRQEKARRSGGVSAPPPHRKESALRRERMMLPHVVPQPKNANAKPPRGTKFLVLMPLTKGNQQFPVVRRDE
jgi:hypothetical protein